MIIYIHGFGSSEKTTKEEALKRLDYIIRDGVGPSHGITAACASGIRAALGILKN
jgi:predicted esterase YcpF (UPF0227 family)